MTSLVEKSLGLTSFLLGLFACILNTCFSKSDPRSTSTFENEVGKNGGLFYWFKGGLDIVCGPNSGGQRSLGYRDLLRLLLMRSGDYSDHHVEHWGHSVGQQPFDFRVMSLKVNRGSPKMISFLLVPTKRGSTMLRNSHMAVYLFRAYLFQSWFKAKSQKQLPFWGSTVFSHTHTLTCGSC